MRVTGGAARGRPLGVPAGARPMTARMREALFVILGGVRGRSVLDLFAGSGVIAAEAASRGARPIVAVERDPRKRRTIRANLAAVDAQATVITAPAERFITAAGRRRQRFDLVCVDPPYAFRHRQGLLTALARSDIVEAAGCVVLHCPAGDAPDAAAAPFTLVDRRRYGQSALLLFRP